MTELTAAQTQAIEDAYNAYGDSRRRVIELETALNSAENTVATLRSMSPEPQMLLIAADGVRAMLAVELENAKADRDAKKISSREAMRQQWPTFDQK